uniref:Uncharacterized protein n=1 Tax=Arundo donax TaxID=35708 RepID=A0A0A9BXN2_ARUDO
MSRHYQMIDYFMFISYLLVTYMF